MRSLRSGLFCLVILFIAQGAFAQAPYDPNNPPPDWVRRRDDNLRALDKLNGKDERGMIANRLPPLPSRRIDPVYTKEEIEKMKALSNPEPAVLAAYKDFLAQPHTGIFRIFPEIGCQSKNFIRVDGDCGNNFFGMKSYSFREKSLFDRDIEFISEQMISQNFFAQGILVPLGDADPAKLGPGSDGMKFLTDLAAPATMDDARKTYAGFVAGVENSGYKYSDRLIPKEGRTYGFRIIAYRIGNDVQLAIEEEFRRGFWPEDKRRFLAVQKDKANRLDVTIALRVVKKNEDDGSLTIIWKELNRRIAPKLTFGKREFYLDLKEQHWENKPSPRTKTR
jgi:hypothetical protein